MHIGQSEIPPLETERQALVVEPKQVQEGGVEVMNVDTVPDDVEPELVGFPTVTPRRVPPASHIVNACG